MPRPSYHIFILSLPQLETSVEAIAVTENAESADGNAAELSDDEAADTTDVTEEVAPLSPIADASDDEEDVAPVAFDFTSR